MSKTADQRTIVSPVNVDKRQEIDVQTGDTVRVITKIPEGDDDYRLQPFEGIVLARKHGNEPGATFTVRQEIDGVGVEKIFPLYSPRIDEIQVVRRARTRRAKLYHIRNKAARQIRREMRRMVNVDLSTKVDEEDYDEAELEDDAEAAENEAGAIDSEADTTADEDAKAQETSSSADDQDGEDKAEDSTEEEEGENGDNEQADEE